MAAAAPQSGQPILNAPPAGSDLPDMGSPAAALLSQSDEYRLGAMVAKQLRDQNAILEDPEISEYINGVGMRLASQSAEGGKGFQYFVIKDPQINAFAVPGGFVFINAGTVLASSTESELAGVMAHETAHVTQHHIARMIRNQQQQSITSAAAHARGHPARRHRRRPGDGGRHRRRPGHGGAAGNQLHARQRDGKPTASASASWPVPATIPTAWAASSRP